MSHDEGYEAAAVPRMAGSGSLPQAEPLLSLTGVSRGYARDSGPVHALRGVSLSLHAGEVLALVGPSGSGKSTLLSVVTGWETPDAGELTFGSSLSATAAPQLPWHDLAVVPQSLGLLEELTVAENVLLPARLAGAARARRDYDERAAGLLSRLHLDSLAERRPSETSLGEQQRAALARALLLDPRILVVDEPTTHQDRARADRVFGELHHAASTGAGIMVATHDRGIVDHADRVVEIRDGSARPWGRVSGCGPPDGALRRAGNATGAATHRRASPEADRSSRQ